MVAQNWFLQRMTTSVFYSCSEQRRLKCEMSQRRDDGADGISFKYGDNAAYYYNMMAAALVLLHEHEVTRVTWLNR